MSLSRTSPWLRPPVLLQCLLGTLWTLLLPFPVTPTTDPAPAPPSNSTLLFDTGAPGNSLRNCSCSTAIQDCSEALANLQCDCHTVQRSALSPGGLRVPGGLAVWVRQPWVLQELLNGSEVSDLRLSSCGLGPLLTQHLAVYGLRRLRVHSSAQGAPHPDQGLSIASGAGVDVRVGGSLSSADPQPPSSVLQVSILDLAVLNGFSALKAYSVAGPTLSSLSQHLPFLSLPPPPSTPNDPLPSNPHQKWVLTFIY
ncbi:exosomal polycystin-1-interacting protein-like [Osmerus mordax]|uniref:exosomal polycystin-1-interacting protein-like n=1 Tax=Osmerus mordax TaxID=8014 RepID=UPI00350E9560